MKPDKKRIFSAALVAAFCVITALTVRLSGDFVPEDSAEVSSRIPVDSALTAESTEASGNTEVDFHSLRELNGDICAWISVPGTAVNYPVLQKTDSLDPYDNYYLDHTADHAEGYPGAVYSQPVSATDFTDPVTVLYGHNMKDGSMFASLHSFEDRDFFDQNRLIIIDTPERTLTYEIFAAVSFSDDLIPYEYDFSIPDGMQRYLEDIKTSDGNIREDMKVTESDRILTLSTCYPDEETRRLLIEAVLISE